MKKLLLLPLMLLSLISCNDDEAMVSGPNQTVVGFPVTAESNVYTAFFSTELATSTLKVPLNLIAYNNEIYPGDVVVSYSITAASTATDGVEYDAPSSLVGVVETGNSSDYIEIQVYPNTFDPVTPKEIVLEIASVNSANATISENHKKIVVVLQGVCPSALQGGYQTTTTRLSNGAVYTWNTELIGKTDLFGTEYTTEYVGNFVGAGQASPTTGAFNSLPGTTNAGYKFTEVCGKLKLESQKLGGVYTNLVFQTPAEYNLSFVDPDTGVITIYYTVTLSPNRSYRSVYTPLP